MMCGRAREAARSWPPKTPLLLALSACSRPLIKKSMSFARLFRVLLPDLAVLVPQLARPRLPRTSRGSILRPETFVFSRFLRAASVRRAKRPTSKKHCKNQYETHFGTAAQRSQIDARSIHVDPEERSATRTHLTSVLGRSRRTSGASQERSWSVFGLSWNTPGRPGSAIRPSRMRPWPFWARPGRFLRRS